VRTVDEILPRQAGAELGDYKRTVERALLVSKDSSCSGPGHAGRRTKTAPTTLPSSCGIFRIAGGRQGVQCGQGWACRRGLQPHYSFCPRRRRREMQCGAPGLASPPAVRALDSA